MKKLSLYNIIKESERDMFEGFNESELTEEYPTTFSFEELKKLNSYRTKKKYIESHLGKPLGIGTSRLVYRVDKTKVLKLAKNKRGLAQNEVEIDWGRETYFNDIVAKVFDFDNDDYYWVEMELALPISVNDFKKIWDVNFKELWLYLHNQFYINHGKRANWYQNIKIKEKLDENEKVQSLLDFMLQSDTIPGDLTKKNSWGKVLREYGEELVLIDFGLTNNVYQSYYS